MAIETWIWEKEQSHRLFNFHDDYKILDKLTDVIGSSIISKKGSNNVVMHKASYYDDRVPTEDREKPASMKNVDNNKLVNIVYNEGEYFVFEPKNPDANKFNIIDNYLWLITKFIAAVTFTKLILPLERNRIV